MKDLFTTFLEKKQISKEDYETKTAKELGELTSEYLEFRLNEIKSENNNKQDELKKTIEALKEKDNATEKNLKEAQESLDQIKEKGFPSSKEDSLKNEYAKNSEKIKNLAVVKTGTVSFEVKAQHNPTDILGREGYATFESGTSQLPFRSFSITEMFQRVPINTEFLSYREEVSVTRDGKFVVACAPSSHDTKKDWKISTTQMTKVRDMTDICIDMLNDYSFVEAEIRQLVEQGVNAKEESGILSGTSGVLSIDTISSEFNSSNVLADYSNSFTGSTIAELTAAMKAQIYTFGAENKWDANVILMNHNDKVKFMHQKNADNDYLLPNFVMTNGGLLNGMRVVTSPLVSANTLYVMDTTLGKILERENTSVESLYQNKDNAEHEVVTLKALKRMQFHVKNIDRNAFMKCSDIATALDAITK